MTCMKCGSEVAEAQVFCDHCLEVMEAYPVKRDVHIHLPKREETTDMPKRSARKKRTPTPEEQLSQLRMKVLRLRLMVAILAFLFCVSSAFLGLKLYEEYFTPQTGMNYTIDTSMNR